MAVASMVLGILALVWMFIPVINIVAPIIAIIGIVLGAVGKKKLAAEGKPTGMATAGMVMSIIALAISTFIVVACAACLGGIAASN